MVQVACFNKDDSVGMVYGYGDIRDTIQPRQNRKHDTTLVITRAWFKWSNTVEVIQLD